VDLVPGETLFLPAKWWHDVHSTCGSVAVSINLTPKRTTDPPRLIPKPQDDATGSQKKRKTKDEAGETRRSSRQPSSFYCRNCNKTFDNLYLPENYEDGKKIDARDLELFCMGCKPPGSTVPITSVDYNRKE
jgi:hypothetical protein